MIFDPLEHPFKQLLWILYKLRMAEKRYAEYLNFSNRKEVAYWQKKADEILATIGIDENTDFKNMQLTIIHK